jgi:hypothetical protein
MDMSSECGSAFGPACDAGSQSSTYDAGHPHDAATQIDAWTPGDAGAFDAATFDASPPDSSITQQCALSIGTGMPQCDTCLGQSCCAQDNACGNSPDCNSFLRCGNDCFSADGGPTQACFDACTTQYPTGSALIDALDACMSSSCATECGGP